MRFKSMLLATTCQWLVIRVAAQSFPYYPTTILPSSQDANILYIFQPSTTASDQVTLTSLNISSTLQSSSLPHTTLTASLPFLGGDAPSMTSFTPAISSSGSIEVYAGVCSSTSSVWTFTPATATKSGNGSWTQLPTTLGAALTSSGSPGANFLATAFSFSTLVGASDAQSSTYIFGGMCPVQSGLTTLTWQASSTYTNRMLRLTPSSSTPSAYQVVLDSTTGNVPIAEAGSTLTGLTPAYTNTSSGIMTQARNFVLLGGHTQTAFINMSQVAVYSLPQDAWSYQTIDVPTTASNADLAIKSTAQNPDSRSGHTTVLSSDGSYLIVFGGWVGNVNTPADPQLAILRLGSGFGGTGDWAWQIPNPTGTALASGQGIYGHGAVMLPGNVMMVTGGTLISATNSKNRRASTTSQTFFFNGTASSWISTYTSPSYVAAAAAAAQSSASGSAASGSSSDYARKVGLGAGLGIGLAAVVAAICVYCWYSRRLKRHRRLDREKDLNTLSRDDTAYHGAGEDPHHVEREAWWSGYARNGHAQHNSWIPWVAPSANTGGSSTDAGHGDMYEPVSSDRSPEYEGHDLGIPAVTVGPRATHTVPRKPVNARTARGYYQQAPTSNQGFDTAPSHHRANSLGTAGAIHPIYEADEDLDVTDHAYASGQQVGDYRDGDVFVSPLEEHADPFNDPPELQYPDNTHRLYSARGLASSYGRTTPTSESSALAREREVATWEADWQAADTLMRTKSRTHSGLTYSGRVSPSKDSYRTHSNLSERSLSTANAVGLSRNNSYRANSLTAFFAGNTWIPFHGVAQAGYQDLGRGAGYTGNISPESDRSGASRHPPQSSGSGTSSFTTAQTSQSGPQTAAQTFGELRLEGQALLPRPAGARPEPSLYRDEPSSPSKTRRRQINWLGSLKKVFTLADEEWVPGQPSSSQSSPTRVRGERSDSVSGTGSDLRPVLTLTGDSPRRSASAGALLWRRKQGRDDWNDSLESDTAPRSNTLTERMVPFLTVEDKGKEKERTSSSEEDEWDIEKAVQSRVVQVMFTVPKEKLRVVNYDPEHDDDGKSEAGSLHTGQSDGKSSKETVGERIEGRKTGEVVGRPMSPARKSRVLEMVEKMEKER